MTGPVECTTCGAKDDTEYRPGPHENDNGELCNGDWVVVPSGGGDVFVSTEEEPSSSVEE